MRGPRTQAQRDATTVESVYVALTAVVLAGAVFAVIAGPALYFDWVTGGARTPLLRAAAATGLVAFAVRLVVGLRRW
ncbi:hypothetical protein SRB5_18290 [Streptomyces sp. RB5]|uniref:Uncharacterized protein n=1 Tax=Streptomyces smaragdinus TaxID=2585196 RepID=A0A7K0CE21_9ACTN|nr:DUF6332 family protein [Streptomyces smaragdinus]MQY11710.1 hypothetical protein [Streptomyces smaragdinus]